MAWAVAVNLSGTQAAANVDFGLTPPLLLAMITGGPQTFADEGSLPRFRRPVVHGFRRIDHELSMGFQLQWPRLHRRRPRACKTQLDLLNVDGPFSEMVALRVTDSRGLSSIATTLFQVLNVPPTATFTGSTVLLGSSATVTFTDPFDPSPADTRAGFSYAFDLDKRWVLRDRSCQQQQRDGCPTPIWLRSARTPSMVKIIDKDGGLQFLQHDRQRSASHIL